MKTWKPLLLPILAVLLVLGIICGSRLSDPANRSKPDGETSGHAAAPVTSKHPAAQTRFPAWMESYVSATPDTRETLLAEGVELARERRMVMETLIRTHPEQALKEAVTLDTWRNLPPAIQAEVEEPFSALANFRVLPADEGREATRWTEIEGRPELQSFVYGRRDSLTTKEKSPVQGIRLGGIAALREEVFQPLAAAEIPLAESVYPLANPRADRDFSTGTLLGEETVTAVAGGRIFKFADEASLQNFDSSIASLDEKPGPHGGAALLFLPYPANDAGGFNLQEAELQNNYLASAWTETKKKLFMIRCDFADRPDPTNPVIGASPYSALLNTTVSDTFRSFSYGKTWIEAEVSTTVIRLPKIAAYYAVDQGDGNSRNAELLSAAKAAYQAANPAFVPSNHDIIGVWFVNIGMKSSGAVYAGLAGGTDLWMQGTTDPVVHVHELGHSYGLAHSGSWEPPTGSTNPLDPAGTSSEYGDIFDVMGSAPLPEGVFHAEAKQRLNWLAAGEWADAATSGSATYRVNRVDHAATTGVRGLRITRAADDYLWLSYRRLFANPWLQSGANVVWKRPGSARSWLVDTTPDSSAGAADKNDASIAIGSTWTNGNIHITPLARGGTSPNEFLDIRVNTGPFQGNVAPTVTLAGPATVSARQTCIFTATAADANGDELAYAWDFGQGFTAENNPEAPFAWSSGGTYTVKVTVSDMKGNRTQATKTVTVTDTINTWTSRTVNDIVAEFTSVVASPDLVVAIADDKHSTSTDGLTWTAGSFGLNRHIKGGAWDGNRFLAVGYEIILTPNFQVLGGIYSSTTASDSSWNRLFRSGATLNGIAFGGGTYVAVGDQGTIQRSTDGVTWTAAASGTTSTLESVAYGNGRFVAVGRAPDTGSGPGVGNVVVLTSGNGINWTNASAGAGLPSWQDFRNVVWAGDRFLASGYYSKLRHSTDAGATFATNRPITEETPAMAYGNGVWFAAGINRDNANADIDLISTDGSNWSPLVTPALDDRTGAVFFKNTFITVGKNRTIRQSAVIAPSADGYITWRNANLADHDALSGAGADRDKDGLANVLEYALGLSPASGSHAYPLPTAVTVAADPLLANRISLQLNLPSPIPADLVYTVEVNSSLSGTWTTLATKTGTGAWVWAPGGTSRIVTGSPADGRVLVTVGDSETTTANRSRFMRLKARINL